MVLPARVRLRIEQRIAAEGHWLESRLLRAAFAAAAVLLIAFASLLLWFPSGTTALAVVQKQGSATALPGELELPAGDWVDLRLTANGILVIRLPQGGLLRFSGPGHYQLQRRQATLAVKVHSGRALVSRPHQGPVAQPVLEWVTARARYRMQGTTAQLEIRRDSERLSVLEGHFLIEQLSDSSGPALPNTVELGTGSQLDLGRVAVRRPLPNEERLQLLAQKQSLERTLAGQKTIDPTRQFRSEADLRVYYGSLSELRLRDGRIFRGFAEVGPEVIRLHGLHGLVEVPATSASSVEPTRPAAESP